MEGATQLKQQQKVTLCDKERGEGVYSSELSILVKTKTNDIMCAGRNKALSGEIRCCKANNGFSWCVSIYFPLLLYAFVFGSTRYVGCFLHLGNITNLDISLYFPGKVVYSPLSARSIHKLSTSPIISPHLVSWDIPPVFCNFFWFSERAEKTQEKSEQTIGLQFLSPHVLKLW